MTAKRQQSHEPAASPSSGRRLIAVSLDALAALLGGLATGAANAMETTDSGTLELRLEAPSFWGTALAMALAVSFLNHVPLTLATRASLGKLLTGLRVVRSSDGGRAGFVPLAGRWLFGFYWLIFFAPIHLATDSDVEQQDAVGLRIARRTAVLK